MLVDREIRPWLAAEQDKTRRLTVRGRARGDPANRPGGRARLARSQCDWLLFDAKRISRPLGSHHSGSTRQAETRKTRPLRPPAVAQTADHQGAGLRYCDLCDAVAIEVEDGRLR